MKAPLLRHRAALATLLLAACGSEPAPPLAPAHPAFLGHPGGEPGVDAMPTALTLARRGPRALAAAMAASPLAIDFADRQSQRSAARWGFRNTLSRPRLENGRLVLELGENAEALLQCDVDAADFTHLLIGLGELTPRLSRKVLTVFWSTPSSGELAYLPQQSASVPYASAEDGYLLVPLSRQPSWRGVIDGIGLALGSNDTLELRSVHGLPLEGLLSFDDVAPDAFVPTSVEIQRLRKGALQVAPRSRLVQSVAIEPGQELRFDFALHPMTAHLATSATRFSVAAVEGDTEHTLVTFDTPGERYPRLAGWHAARIDLSALAGRRVDLVLETEPLAPAPADGAPAAATAVPLWSKPRLASGAASAGPNLLLISVDTLRADHLESYGYDATTSPALSELASQGVLFENCQSHAPSTLPSHGALFTGIPSIENRVYDGDNLLPRARRTLAEVLREAGFATAAFAGGGYFDPYYGLSQGFETYSYAKTGQLAADYSDVEFSTGRALAWLEEHHDRRFFLFFHTYEVHSPYDPRPAFIADYLPAGVEPPTGSTYLSPNNREAPLEAPGYQGWTEYLHQPGAPPLFEPETVAKAVASYDSEIRETDDHLRRLFEALERLDLARDTLVVFTSDHGEAFFEHGRTGHGHLHADNLHVPLIVRFPGRVPGGRRIAQPVQLADVVPTCLDLLGVEAPEAVRGLSLAPTLSGGTPPAGRTIVSYDDLSGISCLGPDGTKVLANILARHPLAGRKELYRPADDPLELHDLYPDAPPELRGELAARITRALEGLPGSHVTLAMDPPMRFVGTLELHDSHSPLRGQLRCFPLEPGWVRLGDDAERAEVTTDYLADWTIFLHRGAGRLVLRGRLEPREGESLVVDELLELGPLPLAPEPPLKRAPGSGARLVARALDPSEGEAEAAAEPSGETLDQLRDLGYF